MKILTHGKIPEDRVYRGKCGHCGCVYEFKRREAKFHSDQRDGDYLKTNCPTCRRPVYTDAR